MVKTSSFWAIHTRVDLLDTPAHMWQVTNGSHRPQFSAAFCPLRSFTSREKQLSLLNVSRSQSSEQLKIYFPCHVKYVLRRATSEMAKEISGSEICSGRIDRFLSLWVESNINQQRAETRKLRHSTSSECAYRERHTGTGNSSRGLRNKLDVDSSLIVKPKEPTSNVVVEALREFPLLITQFERQSPTTSSSSRFFPRSHCLINKFPGKQSPPAHPHDLSFLVELIS